MSGHRQSKGPRTGSSYLRKRAMELAPPAVRATSHPLAEWALKNIRLDHRPFSFQGHEYLRAIYDDTCPHVVLSKAAQTGGTTCGILRSVHACLCGLDVMYFFPTRTDVMDFSKSRVGPLLYDNPFLARAIQNTDTVGLKQIGDAFLYFRGMQSSVGMKSVPADMIVFDELDEATPEARAMAMERVSHSMYKRLLELSNPSLPGYGIDAQYERSDQRHWTLKCPGCGHWTCLEREFPAKLGQEVTVISQRPDGTCYRACPRCAHELDLAQGEWIPDFPDREIHGYRVSQLFSALVDPKEILEEYRNTRHPEQFYNLKIGIPWADLEKRLDVAAVLACAGDVPLEVGERPRTYMGVDTGKDLHVVILQGNLGSEEPIRVVHLDKVREFGELNRLIKEFEVRRCVIDGLPETHATRGFAQRQSASVYLCYFVESQHGSPQWSHQEKSVKVNRTEALDASRALVRDQRIVVPRGSVHLQEFAQHLTCDAKVVEEDPDTGARRSRYVRTGANHFSMAFTYAALALPTHVGLPIAGSRYSSRQWAMERLRRWSGPRYWEDSFRRRMDR